MRRKIERSTAAGNSGEVERDSESKCETGCGRVALSRQPVLGVDEKIRTPALCEECRKLPMSLVNGQWRLESLEEQVRKALNAALVAQRMAVQQAATPRTTLALGGAIVLLAASAGIDEVSEQQLARALHVLRGKGGSLDRALRALALAAKLRADQSWNDQQACSWVRIVVADQLLAGVSDPEILRAIQVAHVQPRQPGRPRKGDMRPTQAERDDALAQLLGKESLIHERSPSVTNQLQRRRREQRKKASKKL